MNTSAPTFTFTLPAMLRAIFARWGEACDPALAPGAPEQAGRLYQELGQETGALRLSRQALAHIEADARFNARYGQFAELRREGEQVLPWVCAVLAAGPAPQHIFIPY